MIIKFLNNKVEEDGTHLTKLHYLESNDYSVDFFPCNSLAEYNRIWDEEVSPNYRVAFPIEYVESDEVPELVVFRIREEDKPFLDYVASNCIVYIMNNDGKTVDKFRIS